MEVKFWGVRGSFPQAPSPTEWESHFRLLLMRFFENGYSKKSDIDQFLSEQKTSFVGGYGSATTCVEVTDQNNKIIIDGGSGLKKISDELSKNNFKETEHHILITHFHYDHIMGIPFFMPHFLKGHRINYYCVHDECEQIIRSLFKKPLFPIEYSKLSAEIIFHKIEPHKKLKINNFFVTPYKTDHPDLCYGFKITNENNKTYSHAVDNEAIRKTKSELGLDACLYENTDLLYIDAQYDKDDMDHKKNWGHGSFSRAFDICNNFNIKQVLLGHHDPSHSTSDIQKLSVNAANYIEQNVEYKNIHWMFVCEGQVVKL